MGSVGGVTRPSRREEVEAEPPPTGEPRLAGGVEEALHRLEVFWIDLEIRPHAGHRVLNGVGKKHHIREIEGRSEGAEQRE